jgi:hypothetical protein
VSGAIGLAFIIRADTANEIDDVVTGLPVWPCMVTTLTPLTTWSGRANALRPRLERLRAGKMLAEAHGLELRDEFRRPSHAHRRLCRQSGRKNGREELS